MPECRPTRAGPGWRRKMAESEGRGDKRPGEARAVPRVPPSCRISCRSLAPGALASAADQMMWREFHGRCPASLAAACGSPGKLREIGRLDPESEICPELRCLAGVAQALGALTQQCTCLRGRARCEVSLIGVTFHLNCCNATLVRHRRVLVIAKMTAISCVRYAPSRSRLMPVSNQTTLDTPDSRADYRDSQSANRADGAADREIVGMRTGDCAAFAQTRIRYESYGLLHSTRYPRI